MKPDFTFPLNFEQIEYSFPPVKQNVKMKYSKMILQRKENYQNKLDKAINCNMHTY